jgi:hypothetical protein
MLCHYSRRCSVSSEKHETASAAEAEEQGGDASGVVTAMVVVGYRPLIDPTEVLSPAAKAAKTLRSRTPARRASTLVIAGQMMVG